MKLWFTKWWRLLPVVGVLTVLVYFTLENYLITCGLRSCKPRDGSAQQLGRWPQQQQQAALSDLNGIEICLSIKFAEPLQRLELKGSPQLGNEGPYSVVYNYLKSSRFYGMNETVTYTTHSTPEFMENIGSVAERWEGPVSVALYVPFTDFCRSVHKMIYLRNCDKAAYREKVTWHIFWLKDSPPPSNWRLVPDETHIDCDKLATDYKHNEDIKKTWRSSQKMPYPVNVARNIARQSATTFFVLPSDVELYPSLGLASQFMEFIKRAAVEPPVKQAFTSSPTDPPLFPTTSSPILAPRVYVVPVWEVDRVLPETKEELLVQVARSTAVYFHRLVCPHCQRFPGIKEWTSKHSTPGEIHAMSWSYRHFPYHRWEPIFICSIQEPLYEERLSWEGLQDKMTQMYELCLRGYQFHLLDRAFLVHAVGIKKRRKGRPTYADWRRPFMDENSRTYDVVLRDLEERYGASERCLRR